eukprot:snap_masked-scaffold_44-processed-gene-1.55-mRNA-1 protein AED:1.00 eAED:1.00 QI:0/0/0/0/1/1/2/0/628
MVLEENVYAFVFLMMNMDIMKKKLDFCHGMKLVLKMSQIQMKKNINYCKLEWDSTQFLGLDVKSKVSINLGKNALLYSDVKSSAGVCNFSDEHYVHLFSELQLCSRNFAVDLLNLKNLKQMEEKKEVNFCNELKICKKKEMELDLLLREKTKSISKINQRTVILQQIASKIGCYEKEKIDFERSRLKRTCSSQTEDSELINKRVEKLVEEKIMILKVNMEEEFKQEVNLMKERFSFENSSSKTENKKVLNDCDLVRIDQVNWNELLNQRKKILRKLISRKFLNFLIRGFCQWKLFKSQESIVTEFSAQSLETSFRHKTKLLNPSFKWMPLSKVLKTENVLLEVKNDLCRLPSELDIWVTFQIKFEKKQLIQKVNLNAKKTDSLKKISDKGIKGLKEFNPNLETTQLENILCQGKTLQAETELTELNLEEINNLDFVLNTELKKRKDKMKENVKNLQSSSLSLLKSKLKKQERVNYSSFKKLNSKKRVIAHPITEKFENSMKQFEETSLFSDSLLFCPQKLMDDSKFSNSKTSVSHLSSSFHNRSNSLIEENQEKNSEKLLSEEVNVERKTIPLKSKKFENILANLPVDLSVMSTEKEPKTEKEKIDEEVGKNFTNILNELPTEEEQTR